MHEESWSTCIRLPELPPVRKRVETFLDSYGMLLVEQRNFGQETNRKRAFAGFAIARVPSAANL